MEAGIAAVVCALERSMAGCGAATALCQSKRRMPAAWPEGLQRYCNNKTSEYCNIAILHGHSYSEY
jgi:hypothetical protein